MRKPNSRKISQILYALQMGPQKMNLECRKMFGVQDSTVTDQRTYGCQVHLLQITFFFGGGEGRQDIVQQTVRTSSHFHVLLIAAT